jgi:hypothetical protein
MRSHFCSNQGWTHSRPFDTHPRNRRALIALGVGLLLAAPATALAGKVTGSLETIDGVRVLKVWGSPYERGYAHGFLLADDIVALFKSALLDPRIIEDPSIYETKLVGEFLPKLRFSRDQETELEGLYAGVLAAKGNMGTFIGPLRRCLTVQDFQTLNTLADWYHFFCSSFSAWGPLTENGELITARNLDFITLPGVRERHVVIVYLEPGQGLKRWVSVTWPGLIGAYTAMNEDGVTVSLHDAPGLGVTTTGPFAPRSFAVREVIEKASANDAVEAAQTVLQQHPCVVGNNIHVSAPFTGQDAPAGVFEYDGNTQLDKGATLRLVTDNKDPLLTTALMCTNHYRRRREPTECDRYETMRAALRDAVAKDRKIDVDGAREIMKAVSVEGTLHTVVFLPNRKEFYLSLADPTTNAARRPATHLNLTNLLKR